MVLASSGKTFKALSTAVRWIAQTELEMLHAIPMVP